METIKQGFQLLVGGAFVLVIILLLFAPSPSDDVELAVDTPKVLNPNGHAVAKHGQDAINIIGSYNACGGDGWLKMLSPELGSILCLDKDPDKVEDNERVGAIFLGIDGGLCVVAGGLVIYLLTAFFMPAKRARKIITRDGYRR